MNDFLAQYCEKNRKKINPDLFTRAFDRPLVEYILDTCRNLEVIPGITLESYELITDQTKIRATINKKNKRDPKIKNNKCLERLTSPNESLYDLLVLHYRVEAKGQVAEVTRRMRIPKEIKGRYQIRNGKMVLPLIQIVDNSTFAKQGGTKKKRDNVLNFKTTLYPIKIFTTPIKVKFVDGESFPVPVFKIDLFTKVTNPLYYFLARYGLVSTIEMFNLERVMAVVPEVIDEDTYMYLKVNNNMYLEIHEKGFFAHPFVGKFVATLWEALLADKQKITLKDAYDKDYWLGRLAEVFSKKRSVNKGERVLVSFNKIMDPFSKRRLALKKYQRRNTFTIMKWLLTNYEELLKKDSNDLRTKRMRANEIQAYFFDSYITKNVNSLLNTDNPSFDRYMRLFNAINEDTIFKASHATGEKSTSTSMFRYERYNDFDAIDLTRYTLKGPTGLNGGKKKTNIRYRDIYVSHLGRYDVNVCSASDQGLTGYLCANVQFDENGYFASDFGEPDGYDPVIDSLIDRRCEPDYVKSRKDIVKVELSRDSDGFVRMKRKRTQLEWTKEFCENPWAHGLYWIGDELHLMPKIDTVDQKGFIRLIPKPKDGRKVQEEDMPRDADGFIILQRTVSKLEQNRRST